MQKHVFLRTRRDVQVCREAANGTEAVEKAKLLRPDLVLLDLAMPEMNGAEVASIFEKDHAGSEGHHLYDVQRKHRKVPDVRGWCGHGAFKTRRNDLADESC